MDSGTIQILVNAVLAIGGSAGLGFWFKARSEKRKINTEAAGILSDKSLAWAERFDKVAERADMRAESLQHQLDSMERQVHMLTSRIEACLGGAPCPVQLLIHTGPTINGHGRLVDE